MKYLDLIKRLDNLSNRQRRGIIVDWLIQHQVNYRMQEYRTGVNVVVDLGTSGRKIGVSSHFDRVEESPGANDNSSAMAVCLDIIRKHQENGNREIGLRIFFFDEEETGLKGSSAYVNQYGVKDMTGLINLELVGMGNKLAIWPVDQDSSGNLLTIVEQCAMERETTTKRFDKIVTNTADHLSFRRAGLTDAFTITCISDKDIAAAGRYYMAMEEGADAATLFSILSQAPIFETYHQPGDTYDKIDESSILLTSSVVWDSIVTASSPPSLRHPCAN